MPSLMWAGIGILVVVIVTWFARVSPGRLLAVYHDGLPVALSGAWVALGYAVVVRREWLAIISGAVVLFHLAVVIPRRVRRRRPAWAESAPTIDLAVANVYVGNRTPDVAARALLATGADVIVINEYGPGFRAAFEAATDRRYRPVVADDASPPEYAVAVVADEQRAARPELVELDGWRVARVSVPCGTEVVTVLAVHLSALTERSGYRRWHRQVRALGQLLATLDPPFVVAGDFNASLFRPAMRGLMRVARLHDAHDVMGRGLSRSLKLADRGLVASVPAFTRVDHALLSEGVAVMDVRNLATAGSDHHPFLVRLAVRPSVTETRPADGEADRADHSRAAAGDGPCPCPSP